MCRLLPAAVVLLVTEPTITAETKEEQDKAIKVFEKFNIGYRIDSKAPGKPIVYINLSNKKMSDKTMPIYVAPFTHLRELQLSNTKITDATLKMIKNHKDMEGLVLDGTLITDDGLVHLKGMTKLKILSLNGTKITDKGLDHLKDLKDIEEFGIGGTAVTDKGLEVVQGFTKLQALNAFNTKATDKGFAALKKALPKLKKLETGK
jgi:hypothetical protein